MTRRLISLLAIPLAVAAQLVLAAGGARAYRTIAETGQSALSDPLALVLVLVALVLVAATALTVALSSLGVLIVGGVSVVAGIIGLAIGPGAFGAPVRSLDPVLSSGLDATVATGGLLVTGVILVAGGLAARLAAGRPGTAARAVSVAVALVAGIAGVLLGATAAYGLWRSLGAFFGGPEPIDIVLLIASVLLLGLAVATAKWSTLGVAILGALMLLAGLVLLVAPRALPVGSGLNELTFGLSILASQGATAATGALLLALALGIRWRRARRV